MENHRKYTAYCGLCRLDCIPSNKKLFKTLKELESLLEDFEFDKYASLKSKANNLLMITQNS